MRVYQSRSLALFSEKFGLASKDEIKATLSVFFFLTGILMASAHALSGLTTITVLNHLRITILFVLAGVVTGSICYGRISQKAYIRLIFGMLIIMGSMMAVTSLNAL